MTGNSLSLVGLGLLGTALAERFLAAGHRVLGFDVDAARRDSLVALGGQAAGSLDELGGNLAGPLVLCLPTSDIVAHVMRELAPHLKPGQIVVDATTGEPEQTAATGARLAERGVRYLDATVSGSSQQAREGQVVVMAGGDAATFAECEDLFHCFASRWFHLGPWGSGARMKLVSNLVLGLNRAVLAEGLSLAAACGLNGPQTLEVLKAGFGYSRIMDTKGQKMLDRDFAPQAKLSQHLKDVRLILAEAARTGAKVPLSEAHRLLLEQVEASGGGELDNAAIIEAFKSEIRSSKSETNPKLETLKRSPFGTF